MNCKRLNQWIDDLLLLPLGEPMPRELTEHVLMCARCKRNHAVAMQVVASIQPSPETVVPEDLEGRIMNTIIEMNAGSRRIQVLQHRRARRWTTAAAAIAALLLIAASTVFYLYSPGKNAGPPASTFSLLTNAWAAEEALFTGSQAIHIVNQIVIREMEDPKLAQGRWFPIVSVEASGRPRYHQLTLAARPGEEYTVDDQAWYDPETGRFARLLSMGDTPLFANAYDGIAVYSLEAGVDGGLKLASQVVAEGFQPPSEPAAFLGIAAGLPNRLDELDESLVADAGVTKLADGSEARVVKAHLFKDETVPDTQGPTEFLFKIRGDDNTIAEMELVVAGQSSLVIRREWTETLEDAEVEWDLSSIEDLINNSHHESAPESGMLPGLVPDMVISDVTIEHLVDRADFETYIFSSPPAWAKERQITDILDVANPPNRMFALTYRADDRRHVVLVQSHSYSEIGRSRAASGTLAYTSPNGIKVWRGSKSKWLAQILISSSRATIQDPPAEDCIGYLLETPDGTFPALAINGPVTDDELHTLVDSLVPAKGFRGK